LTSLTGDVVLHDNVITGLSTAFPLLRFVSDLTQGNELLALSVYPL